MANKNALREATAAIKAGANAETTVTLCKNTISDLKKLPAEQKEKPAAVLGVLAQNEATAAVIVREGALNPLVQLLGGFDGGASAAANALSALANLHQRYRQAIAKAGALAPATPNRWSWSLLFECEGDDGRRTVVQLHRTCSRAAVCRQSGETKV